ncbi:hypothetical protein Scep_018994 [Stephania cephalantha]|uniref:Uncharacterized protein n=1 Tax=Stephania cephalantha TaxID=152367 RepID=A0AAP0NMT8_9MAGN
MSGVGVVGHGFLVAGGVGRLFKEGRVGAIRGERHRGGRKKEATVIRFLTGGGAYARRRRRRGGAAGSPEQGAEALSSSSGSGTWRHLRGNGTWRKKQCCQETGQWRGSPTRQRRREKAWEAMAENPKNGVEGGGN